jgi:hypothetical protein
MAIWEEAQGIVCGGERTLTFHSPPMCGPIWATKMDGWHNGATAEDPYDPTDTAW